jgi:hypothetical protein
MSIFASLLVTNLFYVLSVHYSEERVDFIEEATIILKLEIGISFQVSRAFLEELLQKKVYLEPHGTSTASSVRLQMHVISTLAVMTFLLNFSE